MPDNFIRVKNSSLNDYFCADKIFILGLAKNSHILEKSSKKLFCSQARTIDRGKRFHFREKRGQRHFIFIAKQQTSFR
jgi:hypothetical protein